MGTLQRVLSAEDRLEKIVSDILVDMELRDRLRSGHGNALAINTAARRALFDNLEDVAPAAVRDRPPSFGEDEATSGREGQALALDRAIRRVKKADWRGNRFKEREVHNALRSELSGDDALADRMFEIVKAQRDY